MSWTFGCMAYAKRPGELSKKLDSKTVKCRYLGRSRVASGLYQFLSCEARKVIMA
jgi:hypothetical protein